MHPITTRQKVLNSAILLFFLISAIISFAFLSISIWGDIEASMFDLKYNGEKRLNNLSCPVLLSTKEAGKISAKITNPADRLIKPAVRLHISSSHLATPREENVKFELAPSESKELGWTVDPVQDASFSNMILVKVFLFPNHPIPSKDATCGILVLDLPVSGNLLLYSGIGLSMIGMAGSIFFWNRNNPLMNKRQREVYRALLILAVTLVIGLVASLMGFWLIGSIGVVVALLTSMGTITQMI